MTMLKEKLNQKDCTKQDLADLLNEQIDAVDCSDPLDVLFRVLEVQALLQARFVDSEIAELVDAHHVFELCASIVLTIYQEQATIIPQNLRKLAELLKA